MVSLSYEDVRRLLPDRPETAHKGNFGKILLLCGSRGYTGAAALACMGALRSGAGLVYLGVPSCIYDIEAVKLTEPVIIPLRSQNGKLDAAAFSEIADYLPKMDAVLMGPGLGMSPGTEEVVCSVLEKYSGPVVLDADGINVMKAHKDILRRRTGATILTPHEGEFSRLGGSLSEGRIAGAKALAEETGSILVLKGHETVITDSVRVYINKTGNPGMATGGSGDILAGVIVSLLGQGLNALDAAACGAWLHGKAGDICANQIGQYGMLPSDMLQVLPRLLK